MLPVNEKSVLFLALLAAVLQSASSVYNHKPLLIRSASVLVVE